MTEELPDEKIESAASVPAGDAHRHDVVTAEDGTLLAHLVGVHGLEVPPGLSPSTQDGLHDRLHGSENASDDER